MWDVRGQCRDSSQIGLCLEKCAPGSPALDIVSSVRTTNPDMSGIPTDRRGVPLTCDVARPMRIFQAEGTVAHLEVSRHDRRNIRQLPKPTMLMRDWTMQWCSASTVE